MAWRKWLVRGLSFSALGAILLGIALYQVWTNPAATRALVLGKLTERFRGANVRLEGAQMRLLGGIAVHELRMSRRESLDPDFLCVPSAVIYHDKEQLLHGILAIRKIELFRPTLRLVRERDGSLNLAGVCEKPDLNERVPTLVIKEGTVLVEDRAAEGVTVVEMKDVNLTVINDPLPTLVLDGGGQVDVAGPLRVHARVQRADGESAATVEAPAIPVGPDLVQRLRATAPEVADHLRQLRGQGKVQAQLAYYPGSPYPLAYDLTAQLSGGEFGHARLPLPLDHVEAWLRLVNGKVPEARLTARSGPARLEASLKDLTLPTHPPDSLDELARELDAKAEHVPVSPELFKPLPDKLQEFNTLYSPTGPLTVSYHFRREGSTGWRKRLVLQPEGMAGMFHLFRYPAERVTGSVVTELTSDHGHETTVDLKGYAADQPILLKGTVGGEKKTGPIDLKLVAQNVPLDERVLAALPEKSQQLARQFHPSGRGDVRALIQRAAGQERMTNRYTAVFHDCSVKYSLFPLPLEGVGGVLDIQPDHWECRDFRGTYNGARISVEGFSYHPPPASPAPSATGVQAVGAPAEPPERIRLTIRGEGVGLDKGFEQAIDKAEVPCRPELQKAWNILRPGGQLSFAAEVDECPAQPQDIDVAVNLRGCGMRPRFFDYALAGVSARVRYVNNDRVKHGIYLSDFQAGHGSSGIAVKRGVVLLEGLNGLYTQLIGVRATGLEADDDLLHALPPALRKGLEALKVRGPFDLTTSPDRPGLVVDTTKDPGNQPMIWWDGTVAFQDAAFQAGVGVTGVTGQLSSVGRYNGQQLDTVVGHVLLDRATVVGQPVQNVNARLEVLPREPEVLRVMDLKADLFGGTVGGSARVAFGPLVRYEVDLRALQVQLQQFGAHNKIGELQGPVTAALYLEGSGGDLSALKGNGRLDVPAGKLLRLPPLLDLLKYFGLRQPDRTAFEQARMVFAVEGPRLKVQQLELTGNAVSLYGQGTLGLQGNDLNLDFTATPGRLTQMLPSVIDDVPRAISGQLLKVKMRGDLAKPRYEPEPVPAMTTSLRKVLGGTPEK